MMGAWQPVHTGMESEGRCESIKEVIINLITKCNIHEFVLRMCAIGILYHTQQQQCRLPHPLLIHKQRSPGKRALTSSPQYHYHHTQSTRTQQQGASMKPLTLCGACIRHLRVLVYGSGFHEGGGGRCVLLHCHHLGPEFAMRDNEWTSIINKPTRAWAGSTRGCAIAQNSNCMPTTGYSLGRRL